MALFKISRGTEELLPTKLTDGYAYFCTDTGSFWIDYTDTDGNLQRKQLNAQDAKTLMGKSLDELKTYVAVQPNWNQNDTTALDYIKNRPFYDFLEIKVTGEETVAIVGSAYTYTKISDMVLTVEELKRAMLYYENGGGTISSPYQFTDTIFGTRDKILVITEGNSSENRYLNCTFPTAGIYVNADEVTSVMLGRKELSEVYIPKTIARVPKVATVALPTANWTGDASPYSQVVTISGTTPNSKVDIQPTATQIVELQNKEIALMIENNNGTTTAYAIGGKPTKDYTMQVLITEVQQV